MVKLYSVKKKDKIIDKYGDWIETISRRYGVPDSWVKAILSEEITGIDLMDPVADLLVRINWFRFRIHRFFYQRGILKSPEPKTTFRGLPGKILGKYDSSTGYGQIFAYVAIDAANYALDRGLDDASSLKFTEGRRPDKNNKDDLCTMWHRLARDSRYNIRMTALNLISAGEEMNGHTDFARYTPEEMQKTFTRYNANVRYITDYGKKVYRNSLLYS